MLNPNKVKVTFETLERWLFMNSLGVLQSVLIFEPLILLITAASMLYLVFILPVTNIDLFMLSTLVVKSQRYLTYFFQIVQSVSYHDLAS